MRTYTARQPVAITAWEDGSELELEMVVTYGVTPYRRATQIDPEDLPTVEGVTIRLFDTTSKAERSCPDWLHDHYANDPSFQSWLMSEAADKDEYARDCAAEARMEERRLGL